MTDWGTKITIFCKKRAVYVVYYLDNIKETRVLVATCWKKEKLPLLCKGLTTSSFALLLSPHPEFLPDCLYEGGVNHRNS